MYLCRPALRLLRLPWPRPVPAHDSLSAERTPRPARIRKLEPFAHKASERGLKSTTSTSASPTSRRRPTFLERARLPQGEVLSYSPSAGLYPYRQALASYYNGLGLAVPILDSDVLVTTGSWKRCCLRCWRCAIPATRSSRPSRTTKLRHVRPDGGRGPKSAAHAHRKRLCPALARRVCRSGRPAHPRNPAVQPLKPHRHRLYPRGSD